MQANHKVINQPRHDVVYDESRGEVVSVTPATDGVRPLKSRWLHANLQLTMACNLSCSYCRTASSSQVNTSGELTTEQWVRLFAQLQRSGVRSVFATGGEIFTRPDIWELLQELQSRFVVHILSNGYAFADGLSKEREDVVTRLGSVQISIDSFDPSVHDRFRGSGSWHKAVRAIKTVRALGVDSVISSVIFPGLSDHVRGLSSFADALGSKLLLRPLMSQGRGAKLRGETIEIKNLYEELGRQPYARGFLAYSEELYVFGIKPDDAPCCGVFAYDPKGTRKLTLDN